MKSTLQNTIKKHTFKEGGAVKKQFLKGYNFKNYNDMILSLKEAKTERYDIEDGFDSPENFLKVIEKANERVDEIIDEYKYYDGSDKFLVINVKIYGGGMDKEEAIEKATKKYKLNKSQVEELESDIDDEWVQRVYYNYIDSNRDVDFNDFAELNICKEEILYAGKGGGHLIFQEADFFDEITEELTEYADDNFDSDGEFLEDNYSSYEQFIQSEGKEIKANIGLIYYYEFAFQVFEAYVEMLKGYVEDDMQDELNEKVEEMALYLKPKRKTKKEKVDAYKLGGGVEIQPNQITPKKKILKGNYDEKYLPNKSEILIKFALTDVGSRDKELGDNWYFHIITNLSYQAERLRLTFVVEKLSAKEREKLLSLISFVNYIQEKQKQAKMFGANGNVSDLADFDEVEYLDYDDLEDYDVRSLRLIDNFLINELKSDFNKFYFTYDVSYDLSDAMRDDDFEVPNYDIDYDYVLVLKNQDDFNNASEIFADKSYGSLKKELKLFFSSESDKDFIETKNYVEQELNKIGIYDYFYTKEATKYKDGGNIVPYADLSKEKPQVVNDSAIKIKKSDSISTIPEIDISIIDKTEFIGKDLIIKSSKDAYAIFDEIWDKAKISVQEEMNVLYLNKGNKVIGYYRHTKGGIDGTIIDKEMISGIAVKCLAKAVIIAHNHPSNVLKPSQADLIMTNELNAALLLFNITLLDSLIIGTNDYYSLKDEGKFELGGIMPESEYKTGGKVSRNMDELELDIAKKHGVSLETIKNQIQKGISFEKEHSDDVSVQRKIAKDHVAEFVDYYDRLEKMEKQAKVKRTIKTKNISDYQIKSIKNYLKHKDMKEDDYHVYDSGTILIYKDISDTTFKEISIYIKNSLI